MNVITFCTYQSTDFISTDVNDSEYPVTENNLNYIVPQCNRTE